MKIVNEDGSINAMDVYTSQLGNRFLIIGSEKKGSSIWDTIDTIKLLDKTVERVEDCEKINTPYITITRKKLKTI